MSLSFNEAAEQAKSILEKAISASVEMLITDDKKPEEIVKEAQRIYDTVIACFKNDNAISKPQPVTQTVYGIQKEEVYRQNKIRGQKQYNKQTMTFRGVMIECQDTISYIIIILDIGYEEEIFCYFDKSYGNKLAKFNIGDTLIVTGKWNWSGEDSYAKELDDCSLVDAKEFPDIYGQI